jgi:hypothetical protein
MLVVPDRQRVPVHAVHLQERRAHVKLSGLEPGMEVGGLVSRFEGLRRTDLATITQSGADQPTQARD